MEELNVRATTTETQCHTRKGTASVKVPEAEKYDARAFSLCETAKMV